VAYIFVIFDLRRKKRKKKEEEKSLYPGGSSNIYTQKLNGQGFRA